MAGKNVMEFTSDNWESEVLKSETPVLVDFWAVWCGPCRMIAPTIDQLAEDYEGKVKVGKLNVDDAQDLAAQYRVNTIPQVLLFNGGEEKERIVGAQGKNTFEEAINRNLA